MGRMDRPLRKTTCTARVRVTLDINVSDVWGTGCTLQQISEQATDSAKGVLDRFAATTRGVQLIQVEHVRVSVTEEGER